MTEFVIVATTTDDRAVADAIARAVIERRLGACASITTGESLYRWRGEICAATEFGVQVKTTRDAAPAVQEAILELHAYDLPEILVLPIEGGSSAYLAWIREAAAPNPHVSTAPDA